MTVYGVDVLSDADARFLKSDLAAEFPLYLYWPKDKSTLIYSRSITELLDDPRVAKPLTISCGGMSFLLQSGVVPPPKTAYEEIYILGIGDTAEVIRVNGKVEINFVHQFPFLNANRLSPDEVRPDEDLILLMLAEATISRIDPKRPSFLFHSAGKDSNSIALALAEAGWQDKVTLITHKSKGAADESEISAKIAKQLGFRHQVLHELDQLQAPHQQAIEDYFINAPFPCTDNVTLAYPLYSVQVPELRGANIIDGGGNDSHMMTPPTKRELKTHQLAKWSSKLSGLRNHVKSESMLNPLLRTQAEWCGMAGLSLADANSIYPDNSSVYPHWKRESQERRGWDFYDFKTDILTSVTAAELHIRKARIFADAIGSNFVLPFANAKVADYFAKLPEAYLFDRETLKNKLILRKVLKDRIGLDSDAIGKMGWTYDSRGLVLQNWEAITREIYSCPLWHKPGLEEVVNRMRRRMDGKGWGAGAAGRLLYRVYLVSCWANRCRWVT
jgi:asparagine synthase (glutamine-hydrolysing)